MSDSTRLFQISEPDLAELERLLPDFLERLSHAEAHLRQNAQAQTNDNRLAVQIRRIQKIMTDVRWNYQPHGDIEAIPAE